MFPTIRKSRSPSRAVSAKRSGMRHLLWICPLLTVFSFGLLFWSGPTITNCTYQIDDGVPQPCELPLRTKTDGSANITVRVTMSRNIFSPSSFLVVPDDCLQTLIINGKMIVNSAIPLCDYTKGHIFDFGFWLKKGTNRIEAVLHNDGGDAQFRMQPSWGNPSVFIPSLIAGSSLFLFMLLIMLRQKRGAWSKLMIILFLLASAVRVYYITMTHYSVRAYDADGHIEYIEYLYHNLSLPSPNGGWEFWQPPLYYTISATVYGAAEMFGSGREQALYCIQVLALFLSIWTLWLIWKIGTEIFNDKKASDTTPPLFFALIAFNPALVMLGARINNDVLIVPFMMLSLLLLIRWWRSDKTRWWYLSMIAIGLSILTKSSGLLLLPVAFICLALKSPLSWKRKIRDGLLGLCIIALLAGWLNIYRTVAEQGGYSVVANVGSLNGSLAVKNTPFTYFTFNPIRLVTIPYVSAWEDSTGRNNFWEYVYRSGLFGEFNLGDSLKPLASWIVFWSLFLFAAAIAGFVRSAPIWRTWLPLILVSVILPVGHAAFRFQNPFSPSQDFRHVFLLLVPLAAFAAIGIERISLPFLRSLAMFCAQIFVALCCMLLLSL